MKLYNMFTLLGLFILSAFTHANAADKCSALLQDGVRNQFSQTYERKLFDEFHSAMCSESDSRIKKAKSNGINLGYGDFVFDFASSNKKFANYQETVRRIEELTGLDFSKQLFDSNPMKYFSTPQKRKYLNINIFPESRLITQDEDIIEDVVNHILWNIMKLGVLQ